MQILPVGATEALDDLEQSSLRAICKVLSGIERMIVNGADATDIAQHLYHPDLFIVGEGDPSAARGLPDFMPGFKALLSEGWAPDPIAEYHLYLPAALASDSATTFIEFHVSTGRNRYKAMIYRALYGWVRTDAGWRIKLEMYAEGRL